MIRSGDHSRQPKASVHQHTTVHHQDDGGGGEMSGKADFVRTNKALTAIFRFGGDNAGARRLQRHCSATCRPGQASAGD